jgi:hypothetical protein
VSAPAHSSGAPHARLSAARDWLAVGARALADGDGPRAVRAARCGLEELGDDYAPPGVKDDTGLKLLAADELVGEGRLDDAAALMLRMLETRAELHAHRHGPDATR